MSDQQPKASAAACLSETAEKESNSEVGKHTLCSCDSSYGSNKAVSYVQSKPVSNTDELQGSNKRLTQTTNPNKTCTASSSLSQPPINTCSIQTADQLPIQEVHTVCSY